MKRITRKAWFGPKRFGWGLSPKSWEGWLATLVFVGLLALAGVLLRDSGSFRIPVIVLMVIVFVILAALTSEKSRPDS